MKAGGINRPPAPWRLAVKVNSAACSVEMEMILDMVEGCWWAKLGILPLPSLPDASFPQANFHIPSEAEMKLHCACLSSLRACIS